MAGARGPSPACQALGPTTEASPFTLGALCSHMAASGGILSRAAPVQAEVCWILQHRASIRGDAALTVPLRQLCTVLKRLCSHNAHGHRDYHHHFTGAEVRPGQVKKLVETAKPTKGCSQNLDTTPKTLCFYILNLFYWDIK